MHAMVWIGSEERTYVAIIANANVNVCIVQYRVELFGSGDIAYTCTVQFGCYQYRCDWKGLWCSSSLAAINTDMSEY